MIAVIFVATYLTLHHGLFNVVKGGFNSTAVDSTGLWVSELIRRVQGLSVNASHPLIFGISPSVFMSLRVVNGLVILMNNTEYGYVLLDQFSRQFYNQTTVKIDGYMVDYTPWCTLSVAKNSTTTTSSNPSGAMCILFTVKLTNRTIVGNETYWEPPPFELSVISYLILRRRLQDR